MIPHLLRAAAVVLAVAASTLAGAEPLAAPGDPAWKPVTFPSIEHHTSWQAVESEGRPVWRAESACAASGVALAIEPPIALAGPGTPTRVELRWRWKLEQRLEPSADERTKPGDDFAARVSALFAFDPSKASFRERAERRLGRALYGVELPGRSLGFVWARGQARGRAWESPYGRGVQLIALRGPADRDWREERVELVREYRQRFEEAPTALIGVALMTDSDNGCLAATALYGDFSLSVGGLGPGEALQPTNSQAPRAPTDETLATP